jgi:sugar phosphate isomerase/epimerase
MVHFSVSSMFFHEYQGDEIFTFIEESGLDGIEFWPETPDFWLRGLPIADLKRWIGDHPSITSYTVHTPILDLNPCSINPGVAALSVRHALESLDLAGQIGASVFTLHPGRRTAKRVPTMADFVRFDTMIDQVREAARLSPVKVAIENMERKINSLLCSPEALRELLDREPWLFCTIDVSHAMGTSVDEVVRYIDLCADRLVNVHIARACDGRMHLPLDRHADAATVLRVLGEYGYRGNLTLEIEDRNFDHDYSSEEKCLLLAKELEFMKECIG